jgi:signal transduction histidine kinase
MAGAVRRARRSTSRTLGAGRSATGQPDVSERSTPADPPRSDAGRRPVRVRRAVGSAILLVAATAVTLFAVPLAVAANGFYRDQETSRLTGAAIRAAAELRDAGSTPGRLSVTLPRPRRREDRVGVYSAAGDRLAGTGPAHSAVAVAVTKDEAEHSELAGGQLAVAVPVDRDRADLVVRAGADYDTVLTRTWLTIGAMGLLAVVVMGLAALLARRAAARIAAPMEELTRATTALGAGDFTIQLRGSGIYEADAAGQALGSTARRLGALLERGHSLAADASHQIRTPLTALRLGLERAQITPDADLPAAIEAALRRLDRVESTVEELLVRTRDPIAPVVPTDLAAVVEEARTQRWQELARAAGRDLVVRPQPALPPAAASPAVLHQALDVLVGNALDHGAGPVTVSVRGAADGLAVEVSDGGGGFDQAALAAAFRREDPRARGHGIGLALARDLVESIGGRLVISHPGPGPVLTIVLPRWIASGPEDLAADDG